MKATMTSDEALSQYRAARRNYDEACRTCTRDTRNARYAAYDALKTAELDLIDVVADEVTAKTGEAVSLATLTEHPEMRPMMLDLTLEYLGAAK